MKLETKRTLRFIAMLLTIILGFFLMIVRFDEFVLIEVILTKIAGLALLFAGFKIVKSFFKL